MIARPIVRGLGGGMDHNGDILAVFLEKRADLFLISDIDIVVTIVGHCFQQEAPVPRRARCIAKEQFTPVVVDPNDLGTTRCE
jgi:hypothetical protein